MAVAIVLAGGTGSRMGRDIPKQYIKIKDREILFYSLETFSKHEEISDIILVTRQEDIEFCHKEIVSKYNIQKVKCIVAGGTERYDSVYQGLIAVCSLSPEIVMIHDGARPFVTAEMISESIKTAKEHSACTVGMPVKDTIKIVSTDNEKIVGEETPDRKKLYQIQTPQTFNYTVLKAAYDEMRKDQNHKITDDTMLVEQYKGIKSVIINGSYKNIKITTEEDLEIAEKFLEKF